MTTECSFKELLESGTLMFRAFVAASEPPQANATFGIESQAIFFSVPVFLVVKARFPQGKTSVFLFVPKMCILHNQGDTSLDGGRLP